MVRERQMDGIMQTISNPFNGQVGIWTEDAGGSGESFRLSSVPDQLGKPISDNLVDLVRILARAAARQFAAASIGREATLRALFPSFVDGPQ